MPSHWQDQVELSQYFVEWKYFHDERFVALGPDQMERISQEAFQETLEEFWEVILPNNHPQYQRVSSVTNR